MWELVGNPEDRFSQNEAQIISICLGLFFRHSRVAYSPVSGRIWPKFELMALVIFKFKELIAIEKKETGIELKMLKGSYLRSKWSDLAKVLNNSSFYGCPHYLHHENKSV